MLARAERLHRQLFRPAASRSRACWEPPVDVLETDAEVVVIAALPGVGKGSLQVLIEDAGLVIAGERASPDELRTALIHRLELPQGRFERRVSLPAGRYGQIRHRIANGLLVVTLRKLT